MEELINEEIKKRIVSMEAELRIQEVVLDSLKRGQVEGSEAAQVAQAISAAEFSYATLQRVLGDLKDKYRDIF